MKISWYDCVRNKEALEKRRKRNERNKGGKAHPTYNKKKEG